MSLVPTTQVCMQVAQWLVGWFQLMHSEQMYTWHTIILLVSAISWSKQGGLQGRSCMPGTDGEGQSVFQSDRVSRGYSQFMVQVGWACNVMCTPVSTSDQVGQWVFQSDRVSQRYSQLLVRVMVQVGWACNVMCTPVSTSDQVGQGVFQSDRVSQRYSQLLV